MKKLIFILFVSSSVFAQTENFRNSNFSADFFIGQPIEHDKKLKEAIDGLSYGFLLSWNQASSKNTKFNNLYNYPEKGFSLSYQNFNSDILGEVYSGYRHYNFHLNPSKNNQLFLTTGFGLAYATEKYDAIKNPKNLAIGSHLLAAAYLKFQFLNLFENKKFSINSSLGLFHYSNMSFKNPNLGINTITFSIGAVKFLDELPIKREKVKSINPAQPINYNFVVRSGYNESVEIGSGIYPFYTFSFYGSKQLSNYSNLTLGVDYFNSKFLKHFIKNENQIKGTDHNENKNDRAGIFIGHELTQNRFSFITQLGYTLYAPYVYESRIYERIGFKYNLGKHFFTEISLKVNLFRAEALELGIGYKI